MPKKGGRKARKAPVSPDLVYETVVLSKTTHQAVEKARGKTPRSRFIADLVEQKLGIGSGA